MMNHNKAVTRCAWALGVSDEETLENLSQIYQQGLRHGKSGIGKLSDLSDIGVGKEIRELEDRLHHDDGLIFDLYGEAHAVGEF